MTGPVSDTIFALASGSQPSGIAIVRVSGPQAVESGRRLIVGGWPEERRSALRKFKDPADGLLLDEGMLTWFAGPRSFTGEDVVEFSLHGGKATVEAFLRTLSGFERLRHAERGEFTRRALENGRLDLTQVEGLADLVAAETEMQRRQALDLSEGKLGILLEGWRRDIIHLAAMVESTIDFSDEDDVDLLNHGWLREESRRIASAVEAHLAASGHGEIVRDGFRVVIAGAPNSGKSTLLNALAGRDVAIVSDEAGTTRDIVEVRLDIGGFLVLVSDTAGIRDTDSKVEREGIRRGLERAGKADLVLWLVEPGGQEAPAIQAMAPGRVLAVRTKSDLVANSMGGIAMSAETGYGMNRLLEELRGKAEMAVSKPGFPALSRQRQVDALKGAVAELNSIGSGDIRDVELIAESLRTAAQFIGRLTGKVDVEDLLDVIFAEFCVGK